MFNDNTSTNAILIPLGSIGITLNTDNMHPKNPSDSSHREAAERAQQFNLGWFANPIFGDGDYPNVMKEYIKNKSTEEGRNQSRLPEFTEEEIQQLKGKT